MLPRREETSEVLQNVIVVLWQKYESARDFKRWAFGVARLEVLKFLQARRRDRHIFDDDLVNKLADRAILLESRHSAEREALDRCLQKLPAKHRDLVLTAYAKDSSIESLAILRSQTPMSLYKFLHRIRRTLMECVQRTLAQSILS